MKEQYVGDINDYWKYCVLRALAQDGAIRIGICWMLTPPDGTTEGGNIHYLQEPESYERFDPPLFRLLRAVIDEPAKRRLASIEDSSIIPRAIYYNALTPDRSAERQAWFEQALGALQQADLLFFDPDNGLEIRSKPKGRKGSSKFLFRDEVVAAYTKRHSLLIYQHFPHENRAGFVRRIAGELTALMPLADLWLFNTRHAAFFLAVHPNHQLKFWSIADAFDKRSNPRLSVEHMCGGSL